MLLSKLLQSPSERGGPPQSCGQISPRNVSRIRRKLKSSGPMRFAPKEQERTIKAQIEDLEPFERVCFDRIKAKWEAKYPENGFTDEMYLRFSRCSPGPHRFHEKRALRVMKHHNKRHAALTAERVEKRLRRQVRLALLPLLGVYN